MTDRRDRDEMDALERLLAEARTDVPMPSGAFMARILADAEALQPTARPALQLAGAVPGAEPAGAGLWDILRGLFGGWAPLSGMLTAAVTGVWIGFSGIGGVTQLAQGYLGTGEALGTIDLLPGGGESFAFADEGDF